MIIGFTRQNGHDDDTSSKLKCIREELVKERIATAHKNKTLFKGADDKILSGVHAIMTRNVENHWHDVHKEPASCTHSPNMCDMVMGVAHPIHEKRNRSKQQMEEPIDVCIAQWQVQQKHTNMKVAVLHTDIHNTEPLTDDYPLLHYEDAIGVFMDDTFVCEIQSDSFAGHMFAAGYDLILCDVNNKHVPHTQLLRFAAAEDTHQP